MSDDRRDKFGYAPKDNEFSDKILFDDSEAGVKELTALAKRRQLTVSRQNGELALTKNGKPAGTVTKVGKQLLVSAENWP